MKAAREFADTSAKEVAVRGFLHQPDNPSADTLKLPVSLRPPLATHLPRSYASGLT